MKKLLIILLSLGVVSQSFGVGATDWLKEKGKATGLTLGLSKDKIIKELQRATSPLNRQLEKLEKHISDQKMSECPGFSDARYVIESLNNIVVILAQYLPAEIAQELKQPTDTATSVMRELAAAARYQKDLKLLPEKMKFFEGIE